MSMLSKEVCPVCRSPQWEVFFTMSEVPIYCNVLWSDQQAARSCSKGDIQLAFCANCGFIGNVAFDPARLEYTQAYENALDFSPRFQDYARSLAIGLVEKYNLHKQNIIEIGCGKGEFLISLCELGHNQGVGFDPTYVALPEHERIQGQVKFIRDLYSERYAHYQGDFVCCRHTLEHIEDPITLLKTVRQIIGDRYETAIFFEVPNGLDTFRHLGIWDIIYEHCCFFTPVSLSCAFQLSGFQVHELREEYLGQFLCIEAIPNEVTSELTKEQADDVKQLAIDIAAFVTNFDRKLTIWKDKLEQLSQQGQRAVVWGGGSKGTMFLNLLKAFEQIEYVVDINPRKQGMYAAGTGQRIVSPAFLQQYKPDVVLVMNAIYEEEIQRMLSELGLHAELMSI